MPFPLNPPTPCFFYFSLTSILLIVSHLGYITSIAVDDNNSTIIGAIIDANSRKGKEEITAIKIAVDKFNNNSKNHKLSLIFQNFTGELYRAALTAEELIKENKVQVIVGMDTWQQAALAAEIGNQAQVPVLSLAASASVRPSRQLGRPTLIQMGSNVSEQIRGISAIVHSYHWRRVIAIYEDDAYGGNAEMLTLLSEALQRVGSEIEYHLSLPPISSLSDPRGAVHQELLKLLSTQSRVFIVLQSSLPTATHLFQEARRMDFMGKDSAWIITDSISSFLDSMDTSVISYMEGALGIKSYHSKSNRPFQEFSTQFQKIFTSEYPEEDNAQPGIHALRAYDSIAVITRALERLAGDTNTPKMLLKNILLSDFSGLSGTINFSNSNSLPFIIINIVGKGYTELDFWTQDLDNPFSREGGDKNSGRNTTGILEGPVIWPGYLKRVPKGWEMPTVAKPLKIGIPANATFKNYVKVDEAQIEPEKKYTGFCIDIFRELVKILEQNYSLPYRFIPFFGTYDELVDCVYNKTYDAVVGDVTILATRSKKVEFTVPYAESGLVIVQATSEEPHKAWMFLKPFTWETWVVTGALLIYTMFIVWVLEYQSNNPAFRGPWKSQLGTALWFTFSSLFFAHRETIRSNITRVVIVVWLFVVFVLTSSYTASLSSMLTVQRLEPNVTDIEWLKATRSVVGCNGAAFMREFLENVFNFDGAHIKNISNQNQYHGEFQSGNISAAVLGLPHAKIFTSLFCKNYTAGQPLNRFGGLGFAFQKGSPLATDVSEAILTISEKRILKELEDKWFPRSAECSATENDELSLQNFWALYLLCGATSTLCFILFFLRLLFDFKHHQASRSDAGPSDESVWRKTVQLVHFFHSGQTEIPNERPSNLSPRLTGDEWSTPRWSTVSPSEAPEPPEAPESPEASPPTATMNSRVRRPSDEHESPETPPPTATVDLIETSC
ncbi:hypothetical protein PVL29_012969 [Vitis rotundifolia]|uniref:Glutamate receptor n=1 Tax=Vitis rotundifolia TaxID=103349 RepID=A0AA38ZK87_VITRO|nr:hypothetical protein PVL29_012969 [Vitis rotundifolia]